jgi:hypothetical protein
MLERDRMDSVGPMKEDGAVLRAAISRIVDPLKIVDGLPKKRPVRLGPEGAPSIAP